MILVLIAHPATGKVTWRKMHHSSIFPPPPPPPPPPPYSLRPLHPYSFSHVPYISLLVLVFLTPQISYKAEQV